MARITILEAAAKVLRASGKTLTSTEIHQAIVRESLFSFAAKDPVAMVRSAIAKHLRSHGGPAQPRALVNRVEKDRYKVG